LPKGSNTVHVSQGFVALVVCFVDAQVLALTLSHADVLRCKIEGYNDVIFITTSHDTNQDDGQYARIGISPRDDNAETP
jgi:hypothetical protein